MVHVSTMVIESMLMLAMGFMLGFITLAVVSADRRNEDIKEAYLAGKRDALREQNQRLENMSAGIDELAMRIEKDIQARKEAAGETIDIEKLQERIISNVEN